MRKAISYLLRTGLFLAAGVTPFSLLSQAPNQGDCLGAQPVCDWFYDVPSFPPGEGNILNEINPSTSCLSGGEENGQWYIFTVQTSGLLNFSIIPYDANDDYDWALFNVSNAECADIYTNPSLEISCNFSGLSVNSGITGANGGSTPLDEPEVNVNAGQKFALYVSNYQDVDAGYQLDFSNSTAQIPDNQGPTLISATPVSPCGATQVILRFSEDIQCSSVNPSDFAFTGPGGPYSVTGVYSADCNIGAPYSNEFTLTISPAINAAGVFNLAVVGLIQDICGNGLDLGTNPNLNFNYNSLNLTANVIDADCATANGQATVNVMGGVPPYSYQWNDPAGQTTQTATGLAKGNYTVTVSDGQNCTSTLNVYVDDPTSHTIFLQFTEDTCSKGVGAVRVQVVGTTPPYTYQFTGYNVNQNGPVATCTGITGDSLLYIRVTDVDGCYVDTLVPVPNETNDSLKALFWSDDPVNFLYPQTTVFNQSEYYTQLYWIFPGGNSTDEIVTIQLPGLGLHPVSLVAIDENGCRDTFTSLIEVYYELSVYIPSAFTPNGDGLNEIFEVSGIGIDTNSFEMKIYDRWGKVLFESRNMTSGWDGTVNGQTISDSEQGVYTYRVTLNEWDGKFHQFIGKVVMLK